MAKDKEKGAPAPAGNVEPSQVEPAAPEATRVAPKTEIAVAYRAKANILTKGNAPDYAVRQLLNEEDFKKVPDKYKRKFEKVETVVIVESK